MSEIKKFEGQCLCGAITWKINSEPISQIYCHCDSCQKSHSALMVAVALFQANDVVLTGETTSFSVSKRQNSAIRHSCPSCGTRVANTPAGERNDQLLAMFPSLCSSTKWFLPSMHIFYEDRSIDVSDDLPKYLDLPVEFGGSGQTADTLESN